MAHYPTLAYSNFEVRGDTLPANLRPPPPLDVRVNVCVCLGATMLDGLIDSFVVCVFRVVNRGVLEDRSSPPCRIRCDRRPHIGRSRGWRI